MKALQALSIRQTAQMQADCSANPSSNACRAHVAEATDYLEWRGGWFNPRGSYDVGVGAFYDPLLEGVAGGNLDAILVAARLSVHIIPKCTILKHRGKFL